MAHMEPLGVVLLPSWVLQRLDFSGLISRVAEAFLSSGSDCRYPNGSM